jgi:hypothetical protein
MFFQSAPLVRTAVGMAECAKDVCRQRRSRESVFCLLVEEHHEQFERVYPERCADRC